MHLHKNSRTAVSLTWSESGQISLAKYKFPCLCCRKWAHCDIKLSNVRDFLSAPSNLRWLFAPILRTNPYLTQSDVTELTQNWNSVLVLKLHFLVKVFHFFALLLYACTEFWVLVAAERVEQPCPAQVPLLQELFHWAGLEQTLSFFENSKGLPTKQVVWKPRVCRSCDPAERTLFQSSW